MKKYFCLIPLLVLVCLKDVNAETIAEHDPTMPAVAMPAQDAKQVKEQEPVYILHSTIISPTRRLALVIAVPADSLEKTGDELIKIIDLALDTANYVTVGEKVGNATVLSIEKSAVVLSWSGRKQTIYLFEQKGLEKHT
ncbi:hypothetical protein N9Q05_00325 [bacterium]|nr:hypothetical protein [bacterium]